MASISFGALPWRKKKNLMTACVSMLLKWRASLTCFRTSFLPGHPATWVCRESNYACLKSNCLNWLKVSGLEFVSLKFWINIRTDARTHTHTTRTSIDIIISITYGHVYNTRGGLNGRDSIEDPAPRSRPEHLVIMTFHPFLQSGRWPPTDHVATLMPYDFICLISYT